VLNPDALLLWLVPLLGLTGLFAGVLAGLLGVGGGIVVVPVLYLLFSYLGIDPAVRMHLAVGTSLATIIPTSIRSVRGHARRDAFDRDIFRRFAPSMFAGALAGTVIATGVDFVVLTGTFALIALLVSLHMGLGDPARRLADRLPGGAGAAGLGGLIGALSAMMGIGGGTLSVPTLTLFGVPIHRAVGTASGFGLVISLPAAIGFAWGGFGAAGLPPGSLGYVSLLGLALIVPTTLLSVPAGVRLAHALDPRGLRRAFAVFLGLTSVRMLWDVATLGG
jgi:uncharacterized membrane protein YfcA